MVDIPLVFSPTLLVATLPSEMDTRLIRAVEYPVFFNAEIVVSLNVEYISPEMHWLAVSVLVYSAEWRSKKIVTSIDTEINRHTTTRPTRFCERNEYVTIIVFTESRLTLIEGRARPD